MFEDKDKDFNIFPVLTNEEVNAISSFNTKQGLLESVIENLKEELSNKWKNLALNILNNVIGITH